MEDQSAGREQQQQSAARNKHQQKCKERKRSVHGGGSVYQRRSEGKDRWVATIKDPETGKRLVRYAKSQREANALLEQMKNGIRQGALIAKSRQTLGKYL